MNTKNKNEFTDPLDEPRFFANPSPLSVSQAIELLRDALSLAYGSDYAFTVTGRGQILGCSNLMQGVQYAKTE
jgi:hypothetical protein